MPWFADSLVYDEGRARPGEGGEIVHQQRGNVVAFLCFLFKEWAQPSKPKGKAKVRVRAPSLLAPSLTHAL